MVEAQGYPCKWYRHQKKQFAFLLPHLQYIILKTFILMISTDFLYIYIFFFWCLQMLYLHFNRTYPFSQQNRRAKKQPSPTRNNKKSSVSPERWSWRCGSWNRNLAFVPWGPKPKTQLGVGGNLELLHLFAGRRWWWEWFGWYPVDFHYEEHLSCGRLSDSFFATWNKSWRKAGNHGFWVFEQY